jgi:hypothetical protein
VNFVGSGNTSGDSIDPSARKKRGPQDDKDGMTTTTSDDKGERRQGRDDKGEPQMNPAIA